MKFNLKSFRLGDFLSKRINTILLIVILIIILTGHVVCSCSRISVKKVVERMTTGSSIPASTQGGTGTSGKKVTTTTLSTIGNKPVTSSSLTSQVPASSLTSQVPASSSTSSVPAVVAKEGFTGANTNYGQSAPYLLGSSNGNVVVDTNSWNQPDLVVKCGGSHGKGVSDILGRPKQPIPLQEGELDFFATTPFKPECCPNFYSNHNGCACMTTDQYNYLQTRGGNNVPYSEY